MDKTIARHEKELKNKIDQLNKAKENKIKSAIKQQQDYCNQQQHQDLVEWQLEAANIRKEADNRVSTELAKMESIFGKEISNIKSAFSVSIKAEAMETDNNDKLLNKPTEQSKQIAGILHYILSF